VASKGIDVLPFIKGSVADALRAYRENALEKLETPNSPAAHRQREQNHMYWKPRG
jgi:predicted Fe-Mo cluster-binding NifX family protein